MEFLIQHPFTSLLFISVMIVGILTRVAVGETLPTSVRQRWGVSIKQICEGKNWWTVFTAVFFSHDAFMLYSVTLVGVPSMAMVESKLGTFNTVAVYWSVQIIVWLLMAVAFRSLMRAGIGPGPTVYPMTDVGLSVGLFGVFGVFLWRVWHHPQLIAPWQLYGFTAGVFLYLIVKSLLAPEWLADTGHWSALVLGMIIGMLF